MEENVFALFEQKITMPEKIKEMEKAQVPVKTTIGLLKDSSFKAPASGKTAAEFYHLNSKQNLTSTFTIQKRDCGTLGPPKTAFKLQKNEENKILKGQPRQTRFQSGREWTIEKGDRSNKKPEIPKLQQAPLQGLQSNVNFVRLNMQRAASLKTKPVPQKNDFLAKNDYGQSPGYLKKVKSIVQNEKEFLTLIAQVQNPPPPKPAPLSNEEQQAMFDHLKKRHAEVNREYQTITHVSKVYSRGVQRKKEACEKEMQQIEKDIALFSRGKVLVENSY